MKKCILAVVMAMAVLNVQSATHAKVQLWEGGPYWATTNIGADNPWDYGLYFWWGDTEGHSPSGKTFSFSFEGSNCPTYGKSASTLKREGWIVSKNNGTVDCVLAPSHDAAHVHWGGSWRIPTNQELRDLCYYKCDWTPKTRNGVKGYVVHGRGAYASNSIFLPCAGYGHGTSLGFAGSLGYYWSSSPRYSPDRHYYACIMALRSQDGQYMDDIHICEGLSIRPVQDSNGGAVADCVVHFNANGGVFKDKDGNVLKDANGNAATEFDQHFTYGESKPLFTDELTPMRMDGNGNVFLGWLKGTPNISSSDQLIASGREWTWDDDETEVTFYAVWTTTLTVSFYNSETTSGDRSLSPSSLADHLRWSVDDGSTGGRKTLRCGESIEVCPGLRTVKLDVDSDYEWIAGKFGFNGTESFLNMVNNTFELNIGNDFTDRLIWGTPRPARRNIGVMVEPDGSQPETSGEIVFFYSAAVREELRSLINAQRGNVPVFDLSKVRVSIGRTEVNSSGAVVWDSAHGLDGLELHKYYSLPTGGYYLKDVTYDTDTSGGEPYWGAVLDSTFENQRFEVKDGKITERTINFDVFGGHDAVRVVFDPQGDECARPDMWFLYNSSPYSNSGWIFIDKKMAESLPTPEREGDFRFLGWFTERRGGLEFKSGATISLDKVHWALPFEHTFYAYAQWTNMADYWMYLFPDLVTASGGDIVTAAKMTAANGCKTVGECYALGINPEDPDDDFRITNFEMKDGKPVITLNHTEDGSGSSFLPRVKTLGAKSLGASAQGAKSSGTAMQWDDMTDVADPDAAGYRFFKVEVEMP